MSTPTIIPAFASNRQLTAESFHGRFVEARDAWLSRSPSINTRENYSRDLIQFMTFVGMVQTTWSNWPPFARIRWRPGATCSAAVGLPTVRSGGR